MEEIARQCGLEYEKGEVEEVYVLVNLDEIPEEVHIPPNAPNLLSIGEYDETIGTCYFFKDQDAALVVHGETGPSETNIFSGACIINKNQPTKKQVTPIASFQKIIKFKISEDVDVAPDVLVPT